MNQHKLTKFTIEEKQDIQERYGEWMKPENIVWVEVEYENSLTSLTGLLGSEGYIAIMKKLESLDWLSGYAEKMWVLEKLKDFQMHTSPYIESRIGEYPIENFNDETKQRILLEEIENGGFTGQGFLSDFIENRVKEMSFVSFQEEITARQKLAGLEFHTTSYVAKRIGDYEIEDLDDAVD